MSLHILIVDDVELIRLGLQVHLSNSGFEVLEANDGATALQQVHRQPVDVVLLDIDLPDQNGLDVLGQIKKVRPQLPVVMFSCHDRIEFVAMSLAKGASGYIVKSPSISSLADLLRSVCQGSSIWTDEQLRMADRCGSSYSR